MQLLTFIFICFVGLGAGKADTSLERELEDLETELLELQGGNDKKAYPHSVRVPGKADTGLERELEELETEIFELEGYDKKAYSQSVNENYECYNWSEDDIAAMGAGKGTYEIESKQCKSYPGNVFTQGNNEYYPNCGGCWCCQPKPNENYDCYHWSGEDIAEMGAGKGTYETESKQCEKYPGNVFTQGDNDNYPNCRGCWCCKPKSHENFDCYNWSDDDVAEIGAGKGTYETEAKQCESYTGNVFTQGNNEYYPNCRGCWCCKPTVFECYHWTAEDREVFGNYPTPEQERARCEDDLGYIFTQGDNEDYPGGEGCWCIKPKLN